MRRFGWLVWGLLLGIPAAAPAQSRGCAEQFQKLMEVYQAIGEGYVEEVDTAPLVEEAIRAMLAELDPHSAYLSAEEMEGVRESFEGSFSGIGIEFNVLRDTVVVVSTIAGGPAETAGMRANDRIVRIDTLDAVGLSRTDVPKLLRGPEGSRVTLAVRRAGERTPLHFTLTRGKIPLHTVDAAYRVDERTGYIRVNRFGETTMTEFRAAFDAMPDIEALILDLRGNGGGLLAQAIEMANFFLPRGSLIVSTEGRAVRTQLYHAREEGRFMQGRLVVLIDESSASASEIVAGALQDWDRAMIVGRPSFGKGLVQRQFALRDGSALRLTVARYHTPSGRVIQRPYREGHREEYYRAHLERLGHETADSLPDDSLRYRTLVLQRPVSGGGGIRPDVTVAADTTAWSDYWAALVRKGVIGDFVLDRADRDRDSLLRRYPAVTAFRAGFVADDALTDALAEAGERAGVARDDDALARSRRLMGVQLKALFARQLYGTGAFYEVMNAEGDPEFREATEVLKNWPERGIGARTPRK